MKAEAMAAGLDWEKIKEGAAALIPFAEFLSQQTTTTVDDQIVAYLKLIVGRRRVMGSASPDSAQMVGGPIRDRLSQRVRDRLRQRAIEWGAPAEAVDAALDAMESDRPFIDWLLNGGFEKLLELFLKVIPLFI